MRRYLALLVLLSLAALACNIPSVAATPTPVPPTPEPATPELATPLPSPTAAPTDTPEPTAEAGVNLLAYITPDGQLLVTNVAGGVLGGTTQYTLAGVDDQAFGLAWSPSGEYIAYTSRASTDPHIFYVYAAGAGTPVDLGPGSDPSWSPDSASLVYQREGNLWVTGIDSPEPRQITFQTDWAWGRPVFTPDGGAVVAAGNSFDYIGASGNTQFTLDRIELDGSGTQAPLPGLPHPIEGRLPFDIQYSPDGGSLAFTTSFHLSACSAPSEHYVASADGSGLRVVVSPTLAPAYNIESDISLRGPSIAWSTAGDLLAITGGVWDCSTVLTGGEPQFVAGPQLSLVGLDGTEHVVIPGLLYGPTFDRTGTLLAATLDDAAGTPRVQLFTLAGELLLEVSDGSGAAFQRGSGE